MQSDEKKSTDGNNPTKKRKHIPNLPLLPRVNVKLESIVLEPDAVAVAKNKPGKKNFDQPKSFKKNKKHHPNVKIMSTKGLFSEGFQTELASNSRAGSSLPKLFTRSSTRHSNSEDISKQEQTQTANDIALIEESKELANIIESYGEYFPVALPLTTKLDAIIHENDSNEDLVDEKSVVKAEIQSKNSIAPATKYSDCFSLLMDSCTQTPQKDDYFLFQIPSSYSALLNNDKNVVSTTPDQSVNSEDDFDFNGNDIETPFFNHGNDAGDTVHGFLELTESGQVRLRFGPETYAVDDAINNCFLQEIYVTESDPSIDDDPIIAKVGRVSNKFVCSWSIENKNTESD